jgi:ADP-heptose:LPS heptosyltransferase
MRVITFKRSVNRIRTATFFHPGVPYLVSEQTYRETQEAKRYSGFDLFHDVEEFVPQNWQYDPGKPGPRSLLILNFGKIGDTLWLTALIRKIKKLHPTTEITVISEYDELFFFNRDVKGVRFEPFIMTSLEEYDAYLIMDEVVAGRRDWGQGSSYELLFEAANVPLEDGDGKPYMKLVEADMLNAFSHILRPEDGEQFTTVYHLILGLEASTHLRNLPARKWVEIARFYANKYGKDNPEFKIYGLSASEGPGGAIQSALVEAGIPGYVPLHSRLDLRHVAALMVNAMGVISVDSMYVHMAAAFDTPCVAIMANVPPHVRTMTYPMCVPVWKRAACTYAPCFSKRSSFHYRSHDIIEILPCYTPSRTTCDVMEAVKLEDVTTAFSQALYLRHQFDQHEIRTLPVA